jgi:hypothetical protein
MTLSTEYFDDGHGLLHYGSGILTGREIIASAEHDLQTVKGGLPLRYILVDMTDIEQLKASSVEIREVAQINIAMAKVVGVIGVALVAPQDAPFGMARMWEAFAHATAWHTQVFHDRPAADLWLAAFRRGQAIRVQEKSERI